VYVDVSILVFVCSRFNVYVYEFVCACVHVSSCVCGIVLFHLRLYCAHTHLTGLLLGSTHLFLSGVEYSFSCNNLIHFYLVILSRMRISVKALCNQTIYLKPNEYEKT
jgi:hypothetical protein